VHSLRQISDIAGRHSGDGDAAVVGAVDVIVVLQQSNLFLREAGVAEHTYMNDAAVVMMMMMMIMMVMVMMMQS
jgi:hypothetical protein